MKLAFLFLMSYGTFRYQMRGSGDGEEKALEVSIYEKRPIKYFAAQQ